MTLASVNGNAIVVSVVIEIGTVEMIAMVVVDGVAVLVKKMAKG